MPTSCRHCDSPLSWWERASGVTQCAPCFEKFKTHPTGICEQVLPIPEQSESQVVQYPVTQTRLWVLSALTRHFARLAGFARSRFLGVVSLELLASIVLSASLISLLNIGPRTSLDHLNYGTLLMVVVIITPPLETLLIQTPVGELTRLLKLGFWWQVLAMTLVFALAHSMEGLGTVLCAGLVGGFFFGLTYAARRNRSFSEAYWMTTLLHLINNAVAISLYIFFKSQGS